MAAVGLIARDAPTVRSSVLLLAITVLVWLLELRTRSLLYTLFQSAAWLEHHYMGFRDEVIGYGPFIRVVGTLRTAGSTGQKLLDSPHDEIQWRREQSIAGSLTAGLL